jgi:hypothetical protein
VKSAIQDGSASVLTGVWLVSAVTGGTRTWSCRKANTSTWLCCAMDNQVLSGKHLGHAYLTAACISSHSRSVFISNTRLTFGS